MIGTARWRKASTREQCIALYPGSNPGRASSLRCAAASARQASPRSASQRQASPCRAVARRAKAGKCRLMAPLRAFRGCGIWSKDHPRARLIPSAGFEGRAVGAPFFCAQFPFPRDLMPKRTDLSTILIIGARPIVIGQACEFDYSGTQAVKTLKAEGYRIILVNSNPATIMTDPEFADATYVEPITPEMVEKIIAKERPDTLLPTMGGQTALNTAMKLAAS